MKIGVISNFYPPVIYGGYEIGCAQVVEGLRERGAQVEVLTSASSSAEGPAHVHCWLDVSLGNSLASMPTLQKLAYVARHEHQNMCAFRRFLKETSPDVLYLWNLGHTSHSLLSASLCSGLPTGLFAFDYGLVNSGTDVWNDQTRSVPGSGLRDAQRCLLGLVGGVIRRPRSNTRSFDFIHFPTQYLREFLMKSGFTAKEWVDVKWGVDTVGFHPADALSLGRLLYVGQVAEHKGVHLAIEALAELGRIIPRARLHLTIAGRCLDVGYQARLLDLVKVNGLGGDVDFVGFVKREELASLYRQHAVLIFPSLWEEPMGITILEAMASGLCVVSSGTGGSAELLEFGKTGILFRSGDASHLARQLASLLTDSQRLAAIGRAARAAAIEKFNFNNTLDSIEANLTKITPETHRFYTLPSVPR